MSQQPAQEVEAWPSGACGKGDGPGPQGPFPSSGRTYLRSPTSWESVCQQHEGQLPTRTSTRAPRSPGWAHSPSAFQPPATVPCMAALCLSFSIWEMECSTALPRPLRTGLCLPGRACGLALKPVHTCPFLWYSGQVRLGKTTPWPRAHLGRVPSSSTFHFFGVRVCVHPVL